MLDFETFAESTDLARGLLVLAPHPDDETAGCGGLIARATSAGVPVTVIALTDGSASHRKSRAWPPERLAALRRRELVRALRTLGVRQEPHFLGLPDAATPALPASARQAIVAALAATIAAVRPGLVLTTWRREPHCDHRFAHQVAQAAVSRARADTRLAEYLVWTPITGGPENQPRPDEALEVRLDIEAVRDRKVAALALYKSQLGTVVADDPEGFVLSRDQFERMTGPSETYLL